METEHYISILKEAITALEKGDFDLLKELSNKTIHSASINQDEDSINLAVVMYSLYKIFARTQSPNTKCIKMLSKMISYLEKKEFEKYRGAIQSAMKLISYIDSKFDLYIQDVLSQAKVRKGANIYRHGISLEQVAELMGINLWDLMSYIGAIKIKDEAKSKISAVERIKVAEEVFL